MKKLMIIPLALFFIACGGGDEKKETEKSTGNPADTLTTEAAVETVDTLYVIPDYKKLYPAKLNAEEKKTFKKYFKDSLVAETFALKHAYDSITTEKQMKIYFDYLMGFKRRVSDYLGSDPAMDKWIDAREGAGVASQMMPEEKWDMAYTFVEEGMNELEILNKHFNGLKISCVAECTMLEYVQISDDLFVKAKETKGEADDKFFEMFIDYHTGEYDPDIMNAKWFQGTWDYGGESLLGDGSHLEYLKNIETILEASELFKDKLEIFRQYCVEDITKNTIYTYDTKKILGEVDKILKEVKLSADEKKAMEKRKKEFQNHKGNVTNDDGVPEGIQVGCSTGDCIYG